MKLFKIGKRTLKTAIAVAIIIATFQILQLLDVYTSTGSSEFYASIAAIITMQPTIKSTTKIGLRRIEGTFIGGIIALLIYPFNILLFNDNLAFLFIFLGIILCIHINNLLQTEEGIIVACIVFIASSTFITGGIITYTLLRVLETTYGVIIAYLVNRFIFTSNMQQ